MHRLLAGTGWVQGLWHVFRTALVTHSTQALDRERVRRQGPGRRALFTRGGLCGFDFCAEIYTLRTFISFMMRVVENGESARVRFYFSLYSLRLLGTTRVCDKQSDARHARRGEKEKESRISSSQRE